MLQTRRRETAELAQSQRWLQVTSDPMLAEDGGVTGAVCILSDITERKRLEQQLAQSQKMEALGRLASGIAHDFNNLLTAVTSNASLLLAGTPEGDPDRELLQVIEQAAWRAAELTRQLLPDSQPEPPTPPAGPAQGAEPGKPDEIPGPQETNSPGEESRSNLTKAEAEELLDWLEVHGFQRQVRFPEGGVGFTVRWQQEVPPAMDPSRCRRIYRMPCPGCGSQSARSVARELALLSWVLIACGVLLWPLLILGLRLRQDVWRCRECRRVLERGRLTWDW
jgi:hypothetical protein